MAQIIVIPSPPTSEHLAGLSAIVFEYGGSWMIRCNGVGTVLHECPSDLEPGDTWSSLEPAVQEAMLHIWLHEKLFATP